MSSSKSAPKSYFVELLALLDCEIRPARFRDATVVGGRFFCSLLNRFELPGTGHADWPVLRLRAFRRDDVLPSVECLAELVKERKDGTGRAHGVLIALEKSGFVLAFDGRPRDPC